MRKGGFIYRQIRAYVLLKDKTLSGSVPVLPALVFTQFITIVPLKLFAADAVKGAYCLEAMCLRIG